MSEASKCRDCGWPVGWGAGKCARNMQNFQNDECKDRQVVWLKAQVAAAVKCVQLSEELIGPQSISDFDVRFDARRELDEILLNPARTDPPETDTQSD